MTQDETTAIMSILYTAYPQFYKNCTEEEIDNAVALWTEMFADDKALNVSMAVKSIINNNTSGFPPSIGQVKEMINKLTQPQQMTEQEAWNVVRGAISYYTAGENFERLPDILKRIVGSPNQLQLWSQMEEHEVETVVGSNFMRSYRAKATQEKEYQMLPSSVKSFVNQISDKFNVNLLEG